MTNVVEAMQYASKKAGISAEPNMSMTKSAEAMMAQSNLKAKDRNHHLTNDLSCTPLYVQPDGPHNIECLSLLVNMARHIVINQFKGM